eukprot:CAMPEP_0170084396 /NCGR_PEP_ID=MMETSP0019_2-20121128/19624_1 /TAXON_ID=98059 /ORGANISM="Dinobryon sp., Strain UTEXLB2267" /LENGTH=452 /DNA_ID=CAMNT_0010300505 /DNA_START=250 /DNA_END=1608 /DNA_ORIENTATION=-
MLNHDGLLKINLDFLIPGFTHRRKIKEACREAVKSLPWVSAVQVVDITKPVSGGGVVSQQENLAKSNIGFVVGVSSCKGGVGKSTVAVNLAFALLERGLRVGLLDADIYGPSVPTLVPPLSHSVRRSPSNPKHILPLESLQLLGGEEGRRLKMLSFGHVNPRAGAPGAGGKTAAMVRGPIASKIINQMLFATEWGHLDYLVVDMPPGTGDVHISLAQGLCLSGAVLVTTPHPLALADAAKGVAMFAELRVPTLAVVENMAYMDCEHPEHSHRLYPFGQGGRARLMQGLCEEPPGPTGETLRRCPLVSLPLSPHPDQAPVTYPHPLLRPQYSSLADGVLDELFLLQTRALLVPSVQIHPRGGLLLRYFGPQSAEELLVPEEQLRGRDPRSGDRTAHPSQQQSGARLQGVEVRGSYGAALQWSDGSHEAIFSFQALRRIATESRTELSIHDVQE